MPGREAARDRCLAQHAPDLDGISESLERSFAKTLVVELSSEQVMGALADEDGVGLCQRLKACGQIRRLSDNGMFPRRAAPNDVAYHDDPSSNSHSSLERSSLWTVHLPKAVDDC